ncbi:MAG: Cna B-type domain-containing protein [Clostridiales bacterium]|nr:Cna B-type domain-containing protein [Clostridiales bacterium]
MQNNNAERRKARRMKRRRQSRIKRFAAMVISALMITSIGFTALSGTTTTTESGGSGTFDTEAEANTWKAQIEAKYDEMNDGYTYTLTWEGPTETTSTTDTEEDGAATTTPYGPYDTKEAAESALETAKLEDPSTDFYKVTFSEIEETTTTVTEASSGSVTSSVTYSSETKCTTAMNTEIDNLKSQGYTNVSGTVSSTGGTVTGVTVNSLSKNDYAATEYTITATSSTYIVVKQGTWYFIWTATDMSAYASTFKSYVEANDGGCSGKTFKGMVYGFNTNFSYSDKNSGTYYVTDNGDGTYTLHVDDAERISHMDYGTYTTTTSGGTYSYTITYTIPATTTTKYSFTKTVQNYKYKTVYVISYTVTATQLGSLKITKTTTNGTTPDDTKFTITGPNGYSITKNYSEFENDGTYTLSNLEAGSYTVTEDTDSATVTGYTLEVTNNESSATVSNGNTSTVEITNTYTEVGGLTIKKTSSGADTPSGTTFTVTNSSQETVATVTYNQFTNGSYTINNLTAGDYTVTESGAEVSGYTLTVVNSGTATVSNSTDAGVTITNTYASTTTSTDTGNLKIIKTTNGGTTPADTEFTITGPSDYSKTVKYSEFESDGTYTVENLEIGTYTITEDTDSAKVDDYTLEVTGSGGTATVTKDTTAEITINNSYTEDSGSSGGGSSSGSETGSLKIIKETTGNTTPADTEFTIKNSSGTYENTITYSNFTDGTYTITGLAVGTYTVTESKSSAKVSGYSLEVTNNGDSATVTDGGTASITITNTYTKDSSGGSGGGTSLDEGTHVTVTKEWDDNGYEDVNYPSSITVNLYADGEYVKSKTISASDGWTYTFTGLEKYDGSETITYTVSEDSVTNFTSTVSGSASEGYVITNSYTPTAEDPDDNDLDEADLTEDLTEDLTDDSNGDSSGDSTGDSSGDSSGNSDGSNNGTAISSVPQTGDNSNIILWTVVLAVAAAGMIFAGIYGRKQSGK